MLATVPHVDGLLDLGQPAPQLRVRLAVVLKYRNELELERVIAMQRERHSPMRNRFLSAAQFRAYFAPTAATYARVAWYLRHAGFTVSHTYANRTVIDVSAPPSVVDKYFRTQIDRIGIDGMGPHYTNVKPAYRPAELRDAVQSVLGFDNIEWFQPQYQFVPRQQLTIAESHGSGHPIKGPDGAYGPYAFSIGYDFPSRHLTGGLRFAGRGRTAGIEIPADPSDADLAVFLAYFGIKRLGTTTRIPVDGGPISPSGGASIEATLDYQTLAGLTPAANVALYEFPSFANQDVLDGYNAAVSDNIADTINTGFGACETASIFSARSIGHIFEQGAVQGQTFHAASGDSGTYAYGCHHLNAVLTPADEPYSTAVGGTRLVVNGTGNYVDEIYWNNGYGAGGGGVSTVFKQPKWQRNAGIVASGRAIPDVSFDADPATGEDIVYGGHFIGGGLGGTSLSSPIFGACVIQTEQMLGGRAVQINEPLYADWYTLGYGSESATYAHDIVGGKAFRILVPGMGYDLATGIGSLDCYGAAAAYF